LRIECIFPADEATGVFHVALVGNDLRKVGPSDEVPTTIAKKCYQGSG
jgi:hypothetical protein